LCRWGLRGATPAEDEDAAAVISALLARGVRADVSIGFPFPSQLALLVACQKGYAAAARVLIAGGANVRGAALADACAGGHVGIVRALLRAGADANAMRGEAVWGGTVHARAGAFREAAPSGSGGGGGGAAGAAAAPRFLFGGVTAASPPPASASSIATVVPRFSSGGADSGAELAAQPASAAAPVAARIAPIGSVPSPDGSAPSPDAPRALFKVARTTGHASGAAAPSAIPCRTQLQRNIAAVEDLPPVPWGREPILVATARSGLEDVALALVDAGADAGAVGFDGVSALAHARRRGFAALVSALERAGPR
jgi:hypothetical protein